MCRHKVFCPSRFYCSWGAWVFKGIQSTDLKSNQFFSHPTAPPTTPHPLGPCARPCQCQSPSSPPPYWSEAHQRIPLLPIVFFFFFYLYKYAGWVKPVSHCLCPFLFANCFSCIIIRIIRIIKTLQHLRRRLISPSLGEQFTHSWFLAPVGCTSDTTFVWFWLSPPSRPHLMKSFLK